MTSTVNLDEIEPVIEKFLLNSPVIEEIYGAIESPENLESEDFVEDYDVEVNGETLAVSAEIGETEYDFNEAESDTEYALKHFSGVFHTMYESILNPIRITGENAQINLNVIGEEGKLVHQMSSQEIMDINDQAGINTETRNYGDSPIDEFQEALTEHEEMSEERAYLYFKSLLKNGEYISED